MDVEITEKQASQYNRLYKAALGLTRRHPLIDGEPQSGAPGWFARRQLRRGIGLFEQALAIAPFKWECRFWIGKALQRLGQHEDAMAHFADAGRQEPDNPTIAKEAANAALELGDFAMGITLLDAALARHPTDPVLHYNLAIHLLLSGRPQEALDSLAQAGHLEAHPQTTRLTRYVELVVAGRRRCPQSLVELREGA